MILKALEGEEVPPFTAQTPDTMVSRDFSIAIFVTKTVKTGFRVIQSRVKLKTRHLPEVAAGGD